MNISLKFPRALARRKKIILARNWLELSSADHSANGRSAILPVTPPARGAQRLPYLPHKPSWPHPSGASAARTSTALAPALLRAAAAAPAAQPAALANKPVAVKKVASKTVASKAVIAKKTAPAKKVASTSLVSAVKSLVKKVVVGAANKSIAKVAAKKSAPRKS